MSEHTDYFETEITIPVRIIYIARKEYPVTSVCHEIYGEAEILDIELSECVMNDGIKKTEYHKIPNHLVGVLERSCIDGLEEEALEHAESKLEKSRNGEIEWEHESEIMRSRQK